MKLFRESDSPQEHKEPVGYYALGVYDWIKTRDIIARTKESIIACALQGYEPNITEIYTEKEYKERDRRISEQNQHRTTNRAKGVIESYNIKNPDLNDKPNIK